MYATIKMFDVSRAGLNEWWVWSFPSLMLWLVNGVITACVLAHIFVFGEPITKRGTEASLCFWRNRKQADIDLSRVRDVTGRHWYLCVYEIELYSA